MLVEERSYEKITSEDLRELQRIALEEGKSFFYRNPHLREAYWDSLITIALCQGAAKHFLDGKTGVKDFDIWYFYERILPLDFLTGGVNRLIQNLQNLVYTLMMPQRGIEDVA